MGLFDLFGKKKRKPVQPGNTNSFGEDLNHLDKDGELPWGWLSKNMPICKPYEERMTQIASSLANMKVAEKRVQLKKLIAIYYEYKKFCYSQNECFIKYFSDMWEHCYNSRCKDFEYVTIFEKELQEIEANYSELLQKEQRADYITQNILPYLKAELIAIIRNEPGIMQSDIYKRYDADIKPHISSELYAMDKAKIIRREKSGKSYKLTMI